MAYKIHLAILKNGRFNKLACGQAIEGKNNCINEYTLDATEVTCLRCQNVVNFEDKPKVVEVSTKPVFWHKWCGDGKWVKTTKSDVNYELGKDGINRLINGKIIELGNFTYAHGANAPA